MGARPDIARQEVARAAIWPLTQRNVRAAILLMAGLPRERASDNLETFSADERRRIWSAAEGLTREAGVIAMCASAFPSAAH
jgi:hypothetical protein